MKFSTPKASIEIDNVNYQLESIDEFSFSARVDLPIGIRSHGLLNLGTDNLVVAFRVRDIEDGVAKCSFANLSLTNATTIKKYLRNQQHGFVEGSLNLDSSDELAQEFNSHKPHFSGRASTPETIDATSASKPEGQSAPKSTVPQQSAPRAESAQPTAESSNTLNTTKSPNAYFRASSSADRKSNSRFDIRSLTKLAMAFAMLGLALLAIYVLRSRSTISIGNSALVGNYLPVNVKAEGEIIDLLVSEGDSVKAGDVLMRLKNPVMQSELKQCVAKLATAKTKVTALRKRLETAKRRVSIAARKLTLDLVVAKSEMESATRFSEVAKVNLNRLKPALENGAVTEMEFEVVRQELLAAESKKMVAENTVKQIEFAQYSLKDKILILGDGFDDEIGRLVAELEIAEAEQRELQIALNVVNEQFENLAVTAPRDGSIYVIYRQVGEFVKTADETVGLSFEGKVWAAGQVAADQSRRIRSGQPVVVTAPALGKKFDGVVSAVGHRAISSSGHYTPNFGSDTASSVPVKVIIQDLPDNVPSGTRLEMTIDTGFGFEWLNRTMGYSLRSIANGKPIEAIQRNETDTKDTDNKKQVIGEVAIDL